MWIDCCCNVPYADPPPLDSIQLHLSLSPFADTGFSQLDSSSRTKRTRMPAYFARVSALAPCLAADSHRRSHSPLRGSQTRVISSSRGRKKRNIFRFGTRSENSRALGNATLDLFPIRHHSFAIPVLPRAPFTQYRNPGDLRD